MASPATDGSGVLRVYRPLWFEVFSSAIALFCCTPTRPPRCYTRAIIHMRTDPSDHAAVFISWDRRLWDPTASFGSIDPLNDTPPRSRFAGKIGTRHFLFGGFSPGNHHEFSGTTIWRCSRRSATSFARTRSISCSKQHG